MKNLHLALSETIDHYVSKDTLVSGFARSFISGEPIANACITILETKQQLHTNDEGKFGLFLYPIGNPLTLELKKEGTWWTGYKTTKTATLIVPPEGYNDANYLNNISFQVPSKFSYLVSKIAPAITLQPKPRQSNHCNFFKSATVASGTAIGFAVGGIPGAAIGAISGYASSTIAESLSDNCKAKARK